MRILLNSVKSGTFGWLATASRAKTEKIEVPTVLSRNIVVILYFKAKCLKYNILILNLNSS